MAQKLGLSEREYAAHLGLSRGPVQKMRAAGLLVFHPDGSIDAAGSDARRAGGVTSRRKPPADDDPTAAAASPAGMTLTSARAANEMLKAQERKFRLQQYRGELVDRQRAIALVFRLARQERDAWLSWPPRVAALIAAELGVKPHQVQTVLARHVREHLESLADVRPDFR